jgi:hypothetical protein
VAASVGEQDALAEQVGFGAFEHATLSQKNRRTPRWISSSRPDKAVSDIRRSYRLCTRWA